MKCPYCAVEIHEDFSSSFVQRDGRAFAARNGSGESCNWRVDAMTCPACNKGIIKIGEIIINKGYANSRLIAPKSATRPAPSAEVPPSLAEDYTEASAIILDSPKASAALSRRCLQGTLRDQGYAQHDLAKAIDAVLASNHLPAGLAKSLDAIRNIGNYAAHPMKDKQTGQILAVEPDEAEWNLDVLEGLFDFLYVLPAREKQKIDALNIKL